eukprot:4801297-Karenia_brevis.AAC.1
MDPGKWHRYVLQDLHRAPDAQSHKVFYHGTESVATFLSILRCGGKLKPGEGQSGKPKSRKEPAVWFTSDFPTSWKYAKSRQPQIVLELRSRSALTHRLLDAQKRKLNYSTSDLDGISLEAVFMR